jgi:hypothetical protein
MPQKYTPRIDERWIRHDWRLWIRPDVARWMKPGVDPADVIPALGRERAQNQAARERARGGGTRRRDRTRTPGAGGAPRGAEQDQMSPTFSKTT